MKDSSGEQLHQKFVDFAQQLSNHFPEGDLRFNWCQGSPTIRYHAADVSSEIFELKLSEKNADHLLHEAIFTLKEVYQLFDA